MKSISLRVLALASVTAFGACADTATQPTGPGFEIAVAPLQLTGIGDACYDILVENSTPDGVLAAANNVVSLTNICASQYGNTTGGDITYIAPCDSDTPTGTNWVTIWPTLLDGVGGTELADWQDPCGDAGCQLEAPCNENADTLVEFNITIMRDAQQGFFDVAVNFSDVFCSAKVDCQYANNDYIRLVHGTDGVRTATAVVAFACTDGNDQGSPGATNLYASNVTITCTEGTFTVPVNAAGNVFGSNPAGPVDQAVVFMGTEALQVNGSNAGKVYWNTAIGFDEAGTTGQPVITGYTNCSLSFTATASEGALNLQSQGYLSYPFLTASVGLTDGTGAMTCSQHPINSTAFTTSYLSTIPGSIAWTVDGAAADNGAATSAAQP